MNFDDVRLLTDIARRGSFADVAREREVDPSWVSRTVAGIEQALGFRLFQRTTRRVVPTEAGEIYLRRIQAIAEQFDQARDDALAVTRGPIGTLRMTATVAFGQTVLVPLIPQFRVAYPAVALDLLFTDAMVDLVGDRFDLAIRHGTAMTGDMVVTKLRETRYRVCASADYLAREGWPEHPHDLAHRPCLRFALPGFRSRWSFREPFTEPIIDVEVGGSITVSGALALHSLALAGQGPALLADWLVDGDIAAGRLVDLFPDWHVTATSFETAIWLLYPSRSFLPHKVRVMIDFLKTSMSGGR